MMIQGLLNIFLRCLPLGQDKSARRQQGTGKEVNGAVTRPVGWNGKCFSLTEDLLKVLIFLENREEIQWRRDYRSCSRGS